MRFNAPLFAAVALALAGCGVTVGQVPWRDDVDRCAHDIRSASSSQQRSELVDRCMEAKGWRATRACREMQMQGSVAFCDYER